MPLICKQGGISKALFEFAAGVMGRLKGGLAPALRRRLCEYIEQNLADPLSLGQLAALAALSEYHFARMFRLSMGCSVHDWVAARRLDRAQALLRETALPLADIAAACGYAGASHLSRHVKAGIAADQEEGGEEGEEGEAGQQPEQSCQRRKCPGRGARPLWHAAHQFRCRVNWATSVDPLRKPASPMPRSMRPPSDNR